MKLDEVEYFYEQLDVSKLYNELNDTLYYRLVSTYIPNVLPSEDRIKLTSYFIDKVYERTGKKLDRKNKFILELVKISRNYHIHRKKDLNIKDVQRCCLCGINFNEGLPKNFDNKIDILNPITYFSNRNKIHEKCIDHILPISKIGANEQTNLQYICSICNMGKTDICTVLDKLNLFSERVYIEDREVFKSYQKEFFGNHSERGANKVNFYPLSLFYRVVSRYQKCCLCNSTDKLLTTMPRDSETLYTFDNLIPVCYDCLDNNDTISKMRYYEINL